MKPFDVIRVLGESKTVPEAARKLKVTERTLRRVLQNAGMQSPTNYLTARLEEPETLRVLGIPDNHYPFHSERATALQRRIVEVTKPDVIVIMGDWIDCYELSEFTKDPRRKTRFQDEIDSARTGLRLLEDVCPPNARRIFLMGNHEDRYKRYIAKRAPELAGIATMEHILGLDQWEVVDYGESIAIGKFHFSHDWGPAGKHAAQQTLAATGHCSVFGHTHSAQIAYSGFVDGERHVAMTCGWGGEYDALAFSYKRKQAARRDWVHGIGWCEIETKSGLGWATFVPFLNDSARVAGKYVSL